MKQKPGIYVVAYDLHWPKVNWNVWGCVLDFIKNGPGIEGFIFGGDQMDNEEISHHTKGKPILRERGAYDRNTKSFNEKLLQPLDKLLRGKVKVWITGNHDRFEQDLIMEQPELEGTIERPKLLNLEARNWEVVPLGYAFKLGKLNIIHGEVLTGIGNQAGMYPARKAVALYASNTLAGHTHSPQTFTQIAPVEQTQKWQGTIAPICGTVNPGYLRNRPTAWLGGFVIVELHPDQSFNLYSIIIPNNKFFYGGKEYNAKKK